MPPFQIESTHSVKKGFVSNENRNNKIPFQEKGPTTEHFRRGNVQCQQPFPSIFFFNEFLHFFRWKVQARRKWKRMNKWKQKRRRWTATSAGRRQSKAPRDVSLVSLVFFSTEDVAAGLFYGLVAHLGGRSASCAPCRSIPPCPWRRSAVCSSTPAFLGPKYLFRTFFIYLFIF